MHSVKLCKKYLSFAQNGDLEGVRSVFAANAVVVAPLCGTMHFELFHQKCFADVLLSRTRVRNIFATVNDLSAVALHFTHAWPLANGEAFEFDGVSVFELTDDGRKFAKLTILYDSAPLRARLGEEAGLASISTA